MNCANFLIVCTGCTSADKICTTSKYNVQVHIYLGGDAGGFQKAVGHLCGGMGWH